MRAVIIYRNKSLLAMAVFALISLSLCVSTFIIEHNYQQALEALAIKQDRVTCKHNQIVDVQDCNPSSLTKQESANLKRQFRADYREQSDLDNSYARTQRTISELQLGIVLIFSILMISILIRQERYQLFGWAIPLSIVCIISSSIPLIHLNISSINDDGSSIVNLLTVSELAIIILGFTLAWMLVLTLLKGVGYLLNRS